MATVNSNGNGSLIPAVSYIRMSSDHQEASPEQQRAEIAKLAERDGYRISGAARGQTRFPCFFAG